MKKTIIASAVTTSALLMSGSVLAEASQPTIFGNLNAGVTKVQNETDVDGQAFEASLGVKGQFEKEGFTLLYKLEAEFADAVNNDAGQNDLEIKNALAVLPTQYGAFVVAPRTESGQQKELYGKVDIFEVNAADNSSGLWAQPAAATSVFAWVSPKVNNTHVVGAVLTLNSAPGGDVNNNDQDVDAWAARIIHSNEDFYLGAGVVGVAEKQLPTDQDYYRFAASAGYTFNNVDLGLTWESNKDHPAGDFDVIGAVADVQLNDTWSVGLGHTKKDADNNSNDNSATLLIVRNQIMDNILAYAEVASFDKSNDNYSVGLSIDF